MARYSSDSDSDRSSSKYRRRHRRSRSSSSNSSDSSYRKKSRHTKSKKRYRSRSRDRDRDRGKSSKSQKYSRDSSRDRDRHRYRSHRSKSTSPGRKDRSRKQRSDSREKSSSSSSSQSIPKPIAEKTTTNVVIKDEFSIEPMDRGAVIDEINSEGFVPKQFSSSSKLNNIVIDINADTIQVPKPNITPAVSDSIFHSSILIGQDVKFEKWVKKLYSLRQKALSESMN